MKVFAECDPSYSQGIHRIVRAIKAFAPLGAGIEFVDKVEDADFRILHVIGWGSIPWANPVYPEHSDPFEAMPYAVMQYCVRTSENPRPSLWWDEVWKGARVVASYYDLAAYLDEEWKTTRATEWRRADQPFGDEPFYLTPLGVDATTFQRRGPLRKRFAFGTSGYVAETEGVREVYEATQRAGVELFHLGPRLFNGEGVTFATGIPDALLAQLWSQCLYVAGLRRVEGFELPAAEGLLCGARPVMFDAPHYRDHFGDLAEYVPEVEPAELTERIADILARPYRAVTDNEITRAREIFNWPRIVRGLWERIL